MTKVTEKYVKEKVREIIKIIGRVVPIYTLTPMTVGYGVSGHPDRLLLIGGHLFGLEIKKDINNHHTRPELKPKPNEAAQKLRAAEIRAAGGTWMCVHSGNLWEFVQMVDRCTNGRVLNGLTDADNARLAKLAGL